MYLGDAPDAGTSIGVGATTISGGTTGRILAVTGSVLGQMTTTGSGTVVALATGATLITPNLGVAVATSINKVTITAPATSATLTIPDGVTLNAGAGGTLGSNAFTSTAYAPLASPTFTGTVTTAALTVGSGSVLKLGNAATPGLGAGILAALTNASIVITDSTGQAYRIPCII